MKGRRIKNKIPKREEEMKKREYSYICKYIIIFNFSNHINHTLPYTGFSFLTISVYGQTIHGSAQS